MSAPLPWRTGRRVGRTIYEQRGPEPSDADPLIGVMDTPELAARVVEAVNGAADIIDSPETGYPSRVIEGRHVPCTHDGRVAGAPQRWIGPYEDAWQALDETRRAVAEAIGEDPETWPDHGNAPLAIAAAVALARRKPPAADALGLTDACDSRAARDVLAERARQISAEGYTPEHDDQHVNGEIAAMAAFYAMPDGARDWPATETGYGKTFGEAIKPDCWNAKTGYRRRELIKAGALVLAEIERLDRAAPRAQQPQEPRDG